MARKLRKKRALNSSNHNNEGGSQEINAEKNRSELGEKNRKNKKKKGAKPKF